MPEEMQGNNELVFRPADTIPFVDTNRQVEKLVLDQLATLKE